MAAVGIVGVAAAAAVLAISLGPIVGEWGWTEPAPAAIPAATRDGRTSAPATGSAPADGPAGFTFRIDTSIALPIAALPGLGGDPERPVGVAVGPDGTPEAFVANEVVFRPASPAALEAFLARYGGTVLRDGTPRLLPGNERPADMPASTGWYIVRVDTSMSTLDDLAASMERGGTEGAWSFSSEQAARLAALGTREAANGVSPNFLVDLSECLVCEHPDTGGANLDAAAWWWMTEDDDPATPGDQGLSVGVIHAWEYVKYKGYPPDDRPYTPVTVALIDAGFDLDETTGAPVGGNLDYPPDPLQIDEVGIDATAGGLGYGFPNCPKGCWHGQMSFGTCCGDSNDRFGTAGTSGGEIRPILIKISGDIGTAGTAIFDALYNGADVIAEAGTYDCDWWCRTFFADGLVKSAVGSAKSRGAILVTPSGNGSQDLSDSDRYPCILDGAICVGAVVRSDRGPVAWDRSNWGTVIDMWAPTGVKTTVTRDSAAVASVGMDALYTFGGTSASGPFLAGVVALMKMLDHDLTYDQVRSILVNTANASTDPKVAPRGYVDAYRAVAAVKPNLAPTVQIQEPVASAETTYHDVYLRARVTDPERPSPRWITTDFASTLTFTSDRDGELCTATGDATGGGTVLSCTVARLSMGPHTITATATDPFGATGSASVSITVANTPPTATITFPADGATYHISQKVNLRGFGYDMDDPVDPNVPASRLEWRSNLVAGPLGTGRDLWVSLPEGLHTITLAVRDAKGATASDSIAVTVLVGAGYPTVRIVAPADNSPVGPGESITFSGSASDPEDGEITDDARFAWTSDIDGPLGTARTIAATLSSAGESTVHLITLVVTDSDGHQASQAIRVNVVNLR